MNQKGEHGQGVGRVANELTFNLSSSNSFWIASNSLEEKVMSSILAQ